MTLPFCGGSAQCPRADATRRTNGLTVADIVLTSSPSTNIAYLRLSPKPEIILLCLQIPVLVRIEVDTSNFLQFQVTVATPDAAATAAIKDLLCSQLAAIVA